MFCVKIFLREKSESDLRICWIWRIFVLMLTILPHIEYLIRSNDCVIVPGFGAFISHTVPASLGEDGLLTAPCRLLGFNEALQHNDGLLANSLMRKSGVSYDKAVRMISGDVEALKLQLKEAGEAYMEGIGRFTLSEDNLLTFEPLENRSALVAGDFFGLDDLRLKSVDSLAQEENAVEHKPDFVYLPINRNFFKIAASIIVLIAMSFVLTTPISVDKQPDYAGFKSAVKVMADSSVVSISAVEAAERADSAVVKKAAVVNDAPVVVAEDAYYVVVATFKSRKQAEAYIAGSPLEGLEINDGGGLYRVYAFSGATYGAAKEKMDSSSVLDVVPDAWIYKAKG